MSCNIYYPEDLISVKSSDCRRYVIGHKDACGNFVVICTVPESSLMSLARDQEVMNVDSIKLYVIGTLNFVSDGLFQFSIENGFPIVRSDEKLFMNVIIFKPPKSTHMEFYSLNSVLIRQLTPNEFSDKLACHMNGNMRITKRDENFGEMLFVINSIDYLRYHFLQLNKTGTQNSKSILSYFANPIFFLLTTVCYWCSMVLGSEFVFPNLKLTKISNLFFQLNTRLTLLMRIPRQVGKVKQKTTSLQMIPLLPNYDAALEYIKFYNLIYVIIIDLLLGNVLRGIIYQHFNTIMELLRYVTFKMLFSDLSDLIKWLMDNPGGFKLNPELSNFIAELYIWALQFWYNQVMGNLKYLHLQFIFKMVLSLSKIFGATMILACLLDVIIFLQIHISCFCLSMTRIYNWQLNILKSLFRLFYGKKYNILRERIDSQSYDFDQLLLGIIIFTVLIYLLPTIIAFYLSFVVLNLAFYFLSFGLQMIILSINELPIFIILLSLKNPKRLSDGLSFKFQKATKNQIVIKMNSKSLSLFKLLAYYWKLMNLNVELISFKKILINILSGDLINKVDYEKIYDNFKNI